MTKLDDKFKAYQVARAAASEAQQKLTTVIAESNTIEGRLVESRLAAELANEHLSALLESADTLEDRVAEARREVVKAVRSMRQASEAIPALVHSEFSGVLGSLKAEPEAEEVKDGEYEELNEVPADASEAVPA